MSECDDEVARILRLLNNGWDPDQLSRRPDEDAVREAMGRYRAVAGTREADWKGVSPEPIEGTVYYVRTCCRVKIGFTTDIDTCMASLNPDEILASEPGTMKTERERHEQFAADNIRGEWFDAGSPAIKAHVEALNRGMERRKLLKTDEAEKYTGRDRMTLYRWVREGRITRHHDGRELRYDFLELPPWGGVGTPPPPPPKKKRP